MSAPAKTLVVKKYDLQERTLQYAKDIRSFVQKLPKTISNFDDVKQLIRSSGSVGANYIEANEALSKKDFLMRMKISRKEAKESFYWLQLLEQEQDEKLKNEHERLLQETKELEYIFAAIIRKSAPS